MCFCLFSPHTLSDVATPFIWISEVSLLTAVLQNQNVAVVHCGLNLSVERVAARLTDSCLVASLQNQPPYLHRSASAELFLPACEGGVRGQTLFSW